MLNLQDWADAIVAAVPALADARRAVESELLALAAMQVLQGRSLLPEGAVFVGGTALRLCYGSPRSSEGLDFHIAPGVPRGEMDAPALAEGVRELVGADVHVTLPTSRASSTYARLSAALPGWTPDVPRIRTKIDLGVGRQLDARDTLVRLSMAGGQVPGLGDMADPFTFPVSSPDEIFVDKHLALVDRARHIKHRDLFDLMWLHHRGVVFDAEMLRAKLTSDARRTFVDALLARAEAGKRALLEGQYQAEMRRFLPRGSEWLFDGGNMADMANAFAGIIQDNAKALRLSLTRTVR